MIIKEEDKLFQQWQQWQNMLAVQIYAGKEN